MGIDSHGKDIQFKNKKIFEERIKKHNGKKLHKDEKYPGHLHPVVLCLL